MYTCIDSRQAVSRLRSKKFTDKMPKLTIIHLHQAYVWGDGGGGGGVGQWAMGGRDTTVILAAVALTGGRV